MFANESSHEAEWQDVAPRVDGALEQLPEDSVFLRTLSTWILSLHKLTDSDTGASSRALHEVARTSEKAGNVMIALPAVCQIAGLSVRRGKLHEAQAIYRRALELGTDESGRRLPIASEALIGLGRLSYEWNDLKTAARCLEESIVLSQRWSETSALDAYISLAHVRHAQGDRNGVRDAIQKAQQMALIYGKLGVNSRTQAVARANALGILTAT